ncbi:glycosyltransferase [Phormidium yuhuli AB48]|uniref:Glycosyltransferase n=1 Tax=Phormidium yuhuli AB48 TaxID=2940671 RepID=A0ABY5ARQ8_9CYAN|nr:glycosyltransferase [Phormidium yuhuli]USR91522.1 glycosyltransferase [Phormidium yuhuli AB48]
MFQPLIITGMHRSGTSLVASLIQAAGVHLGDRFVEADSHNAPGYFEDEDIVGFQRWLLQSITPDNEEGWHDWGWTVSDPIHSQDLTAFEGKARQLIRERLQLNQPWGWKDPRTSLLLDFWYRQLPEAKFVLVYRHPWDVADSMRRLQAPIFQEHPDWLLQIWAYYNRHLWDFYRRHGDRCLLVHSNAVLEQPQQFSQLLRDKLEIPLETDLTPERVAEIYQPHLFHTLDYHHPFAESVRQRASRHLLWLAELNHLADLPQDIPQDGETHPSLPLTVSRQLPNLNLGPQTLNIPAVTVVIPVFNQGEFLLEALASVQSCQEPIYEIVIVNDASTDALTLRVLEYLRQKGFTVVDHFENKGLAEARNTGFQQAQGHYVLPLDADNKIRPEYITKSIEVLDKNSDIGVVYGDAEYIGDKQGIWQVPPFDVNRLAVGNYIDACAVIRKRLWEDCGGYDPHIPDKMGYEDWDLWLSAAERGWQFYHLDEVLFEYRFRRESMVSRCNIPENRERLMHYLCAKHLDLYVTNFPSIFAKKDSELLAERLQVETLKQEIDALVDERDRTQEDVRYYQTELHQANLELQQMQSKLFPTQAELEAKQQECNDLRQETEELHHKLFDALQNKEALSVELKAVKEDLKAVENYGNDRFEAVHNHYCQALLNLQQQLQAERAQVQAIQGNLAAHQATIAAMEDTKFWKLRILWFKFKTPLLRLLKRSPEVPPAPTSPYPDPNPDIYRLWLSQNSPRPGDLMRCQREVEQFEYQPTISVVMPVYNTPADYLEQAIESVLAQIYPHWQLCIADDASPQPHVRTTLEKYRQQDERIHVVYRSENGHISEASNSALELATGEFIALMDHDDLLTPDALFEVVEALNNCPDTDMIYSDEDKVDEQNQLKDPFFKPDWCPDSFLSRMYTCHLGVYRRRLIEDIGGFRTGFEGAQDYDLVLRFTETSDRIVHIPKILYHWRSHPESTASRLASKSYASTAAAKALTEALQRRGEPGIVTPTPSGHWLPRYEIRKPGKVSIIIPTKDLASTLNTCLTSIFRLTTYPDYEVIVVDNGSSQRQTQRLFKTWAKREPKRFRVEPLDIPFNYPKLNNLGVSKANGDYLLFLNNDTEVTQGDWLSAMVEQAQRPSIGAVGATLLYPDNTIQHAGVVLGIGGVAGHSHKFYPKDAIGYFAQLQTVNNYSAVTAACLLCRREVFDAVDGFEESLSVAFNDVDFCLKMIEKGYRNVCLPHVRLYHYESKSRGQENTPEKQLRFKQEIDYMKHRWGDYLDDDPCYNPHLSREREDYSLALTSPSLAPVI